MTGERPEGAMDLYPFVVHLARAMMDMQLYGREHAVARRSLAECHEKLAQTLVSTDALDITWPEGRLSVNGVEIDAKQKAVASLIARLRGLDISNVTIRTGITGTELEHLAIMIGAPREELDAAGGFAAVSAQLGLKHVDFRRVTYQAVEDDEEVVAKEKEKETEAEDEGDSGTARERAIREFREFLTSARGDAASREAVQTVSREPEVMAEAIAEAGAQPGETVEAAAVRILANLRRSYEALKGTFNLKTRKASKEVTGVLDHLEEALVEKLKAMGAPVDPASLTDAMGRLRTDAMVSFLASEYLRKQSGVTRSERELASFIEANAGTEGAAGDVGALLREQGIPGSVLERMRATGAAGLVQGGDGDGGGQLGDLLSDVRAAGAKGGVDEARLATLLQQVGREVDQLVETAQARIEALENDLSALNAEPDSVAKSGRALDVIRTVGEVVQELRQPLSVVNCAIDVIGSRNPGGLDETQSEMLSLAAASASQLETMIGRIHRVAGCPASLAPDADVRRMLQEG